jgi:hypothetical protein
VAEERHLALRERIPQSLLDCTGKQSEIGYLAVYINSIESFCVRLGDSQLGSAEAILRQLERLGVLEQETDYYSPVPLAEYRAFAGKFVGRNETLEEARQLLRLSTKQKQQNSDDNSLSFLLLLRLGGLWEHKERQELARQTFWTIWLSD